MINPKTMLIIIVIFLAIVVSNFIMNIQTAIKVSSIHNSLSNYTVVEIQEIE